MFDLHTHWTSFLTRLRMPKNIRKILVEKNLLRIIHLTPSLIIFSSIFLIIALSKPNKTHLEIVYYSFMDLISCISFISAIILTKRKNTSSLLRNFPLFFIYIGFMALCAIFFHYSHNHFNNFVFFVCILIITPLAFAIEPFVYNSVLLITFCFIAKIIYINFGVTALLNVILFTLIVYILGVARWLSLRSRYLHEQAIEEHERMINQELEMASTVQKAFYHHELNNIKNWDIAYYNNPMISLSGDLFDFYTHKDKLSGLSIFDVSGHGLSSGLVTMLVKNAMEDEFYDNEDKELGFTMQRINKRVREEKGNIENYLTGIILRINDNKIEMSDAGHPVPIIYNEKTGLCDFLQCDVKYRQGAIGLADLDFDFNSLNFSLSKGDKIILYTDGITESKNVYGQEYGKDRFLTSIQNNCTLPVKQMMDAVVNDVFNFIGESPRTDDISLIIMKYQ